VHLLNIDINSRVIYLQEREDSSSDSAGIDFRMAQNFVKNINILQKMSFDPFAIYMQTVGGCWHSGMGIYDAIKLSPCKSTMVGYSLVCSMGTIIMQAADKRFLTPNCMFMCHYGSTNNSGDFLSAQNYSTVDNNNMRAMVDIYANRCHKTGKFFKDKEYSLSRVKSYIKRKMKDGDWYMTADEAVQYGFADAVLPKSLKI
jgi:ATP-dependent protease ClpP protease subunit